MNKVCVYTINLFDREYVSACCMDLNRVLMKGIPVPDFEDELVANLRGRPFPPPQDQQRL